MNADPQPCLNFCVKFISVYGKTRFNFVVAIRVLVPNLKKAVWKWLEVLSAPWPELSDLESRDPADSVVSLTLSLPGWPAWQHLAAHWQLQRLFWIAVNFWWHGYVKTKGPDLDWIGTYELLIVSGKLIVLRIRNTSCNFRVGKILERDQRYFSYRYLVRLCEKNSFDKNNIVNK